MVDESAGVVEMRIETHDNSLLVDEDVTVTVTTADGSAGGCGLNHLFVMMIAVLCSEW